jgi:electron transport complex, rnfABCDGE type, E subunit
MKEYVRIFTNGLLKENPLIMLMIGLCSALAITTSVANGIGMGLAMTFVIVLSEMIISMFRKFIPNDIRIPIFIIVIASFTTIVDLLMQAFLPELSESMGIFIKLIVVNCIIMGRVESFASKESPIKAMADALGMGLGFTWVLVVMSAIRELLGTGSVLGVHILPDDYLIKFFANSPGGFFVFGMLIALTYLVQDQKKLKAARKAAAVKEAALKAAAAKEAAAKEAAAKEAALKAAAAAKEAEQKAAELKADAEKQQASAPDKPSAEAAPAAEENKNGAV